MILDVPKFVASERPYWQELNAILDRLDNDPYSHLSLAEVTRLRYLYGRGASALARLAPFSEIEAREYLESLVARAYAACHPQRRQSAQGVWCPLCASHAQRFRPKRWLIETLPQTFRRHARAFALSVALTIAGSTFGSLALLLDPNAKPVLMPFSALLQSPAERVKHEESQKKDRIGPFRSTFAAQLVTHNIKVALTTFALGASWGIGSAVLLFYNGVTLGAVIADYAKAGYGPFVAGWLLPHGVIEIPAILVAGQAAFVLASGIIGWGNGVSRRARLRAVGGDILTLAGGSALLLVWAGIIEAFLSQYHYPVLPYGVKIAFGLIEATLLTAYLWRAGRT
ncbi:MAG TPA: stage II sporulation protein M [Terriglobales bacterium]|nr:stage II sporulation protein M [Terriglobales bacterium]